MNPHDGDGYPRAMIFLCWTCGGAWEGLWPHRSYMVEFADVTFCGKGCMAEAEFALYRLSLLGVDAEVSTFVDLIGLEVQHLEGELLAA